MNNINFETTYLNDISFCIYLRRKPLVVCTNSTYRNKEKIKYSYYYIPNSKNIQSKSGNWNSGKSKSVRDSECSN